jgi:hypothetical protein
VSASRAAPGDFGAKLSWKFTAESSWYLLRPKYTAWSDSVPVFSTFARSFSAISRLSVIATSASLILPACVYVFARLICASPYVGCFLPNCFSMSARYASSSFSARATSPSSRARSAIIVL